ncbi:MAG: NADH-quinone oxidoreductase subunit NuoH [bacterium]
MWTDPAILEWIFILVKIIVIFGLVLSIVPYTVLAERRICAWIQDRVGPNRVGFQGLLQPIADALKLMLKEDMLSNHVHKVVFTLAPALVFMPSLMVLAVIPWGSAIGPMTCVLSDMNAGMLFALAVASFSVYGIALAGWASNSKYPFLGGMRSAAQMISYEVCLGLSLVPLFMQTGSLNLSAIVGYQTQHGWLMVYHPVACFIFITSLFAECNRTPFDLPEAEQELVSGYNIEYSSLKFGLFFLGEYANMLVASALVTTLFLGGWSLPFAPFNAPAKVIWVGLAHVGIFVAKVCAMLFLFIWVRWTVPRFRYDQLMALGWKVFFPLALVNIVVVAVIMACRANL